MSNPGSGVARIRYHVTRRRLSPPLGFVHMPKAGGTALMAEMDAVLRPRLRVGGWDASQTGGFSDFDSMQAAFRQCIARSPDDLPIDADFIAGHYALSTIVQRFPAARKMTILREPRSRLMSLWHYFRTYSDSVIAGYGGWGEQLAISRRSFHEFLSTSSLACITDNAMLRLVLWPHRAIPVEDFIAPQDDQGLIAVAIARLDEFDFVDIIENGAMRARLRQWLQANWGRTIWSNVKRLVNGPPRINDNAARRSAWPLAQGMSGELSSEAQELLARSVRLDRVLWRRVAGKVFNDQLDIVEASASERFIRKIDRLYRDRLDPAR